MFSKIKHFFYFPVASYFAFFARINLKRWKPKVVVITGSTGKTTLLHLISSQVGEVAKYSFGANSAIGIPFDLLGLKRTKLTIDEWPILFLMAPLGIFNKIPKEKIYIVEVDCDRPREGRFLAELLKPEVTLWINSSRTHSMNFEDSVEYGKYKSYEEAIAYEFGNLIKKTSKLVLVNGDDDNIKNQLNRTKSVVKKITLSKLKRSYQINLASTEFEIDKNIYKFKYLLPEETFYSILMSLELKKYLGIESADDFSKFELPPSRNSLFKGIKNTTLIDSTYNSNILSIKAMLNLFGKINASTKWAVLGDLLEQGKNEKNEHELLAKEIMKYRFDRLILMGPRVTKYTFPILKENMPEAQIITFMNPNEVLGYLKSNIQGEETILFKGARFLDGVIEALLVNKSDANKLARREKIWQIRRKKFGI